MSEKHAGFIVNRGGTANDVLRLMEYVIETIDKKYSLILEPEIKILR